MMRAVVGVLAKRQASTAGASSSYLPPPVASLKEIGKLESKYPQAHPELFSKMKTFYQRVPKGEAPVVKRQGFWGQYYDTYFESGPHSKGLWPVLHFIGVMVPLGYYLSYFKGGHYHPTKEFH